jgi:hypothetical protein
MKHRLLILILVLCLASMACKAVSIPGSQPTPEPTEPVATQTEAVVENTPTKEQPTETSAPTATKEATATKAPTAKAEIKNTATSAPAKSPTPQASPTASGSISDTFDTTSTDWSKPLIVTSQSPRPKSTFTVTKGRLLYAIKDKETYAYQFNKNELNADVSVQTTFENLGDLNNSVVLVCRAAPDNSAWYEVRVSSKGSYSFYRYDRALKEKNGKNPYTELVTAGVNFKYLFPDKANTIKFTCKGDTLTLDVNNGLKVFTVKDATLTKGGLVGLGGLSFQDLDVTIAFDDFKASNLP